MENFPFIPVLIGLFLSILVCAVWLTWNFTKASMLNKMGSPELPPAERKVAAPPTAPEASPPLLSIRRSITLMWEIRVQGQRYRTLQAVPEEPVREEVVLALRELVTFARDYAQKSPAAKAAPPRPQPVPPPTPRPSTPPIRTSTPPMALGFNLAQEIGDIVAELQAQVPAIQGHAITLQNAPTGGLHFVVDGDVYEDVSEIPDPKIQALIRHATKEWERR